MSKPVVRRTSERGGVLRSQQFKDGLQLQCTAGPYHFDAFVKPDDDWARLVISEAGVSTQEEPEASQVGMTITEEFSELLVEFFQHIAQEFEHTKQRRPETRVKLWANALGDTQQELKQAHAQIEHLQAELKAVRAHKRKPRAPKVDNPSPVGAIQ